MIFNGEDLSNRIIIQNIKRGMTPEINAITLNPPNKFGSHFVRRKIGARMIEVDFTVLESTRALLLDEIKSLASILVTDEPKVLKFSDDTVQYNAILMDGVNIDEIHSRGTGRLKFVCDDPYKHEAFETSLTDPTSLFLDCKPTPCQLELTLVEASTYIQIGIGSEVIRFEQDFIIGDVVKIDTGLRTAVLNNTIDIRPKKTILSDWILAQTGAVSVYPASSTLKVTYRKRWL